MFYFAVLTFSYNIKLQKVTELKVSNYVNEKILAKILAVTTHSEVHAEV